MYTLGINAAFHDSAACLLKDGQLLAAAEDERFTHIKHGKRPIPFSAYELPFHAISYCLEAGGIHLREVDHVAYSFDPYQLLDTPEAEQIAVPLKDKRIPLAEKWKSPWDPLFITSIVNAPGQLVDGYPHHLRQRFAGAQLSEDQWHFVDHHLSHAASAFLPSPFPEAAVMTLDGRGETATSTFSIGRGNDMQRIRQVNMPHSLGLLYEQVTSYLGFLHSSDEYRVMALASYGKPVYVQPFRDMIHLTGNGGYEIDEEHFTELFGPPRQKGEAFTMQHFNIAHSLQVVLQETVLELSRWLQQETGADKLCFAGGVALNCVLNASIRDAGIFKDIWVQPAAGDAGTALGAAMWTDARLRENSGRSFLMEHAYWGPSYDDEEIRAFLKWAKVPHRKMEDVAGETAELLAQQKIIGWFQGRMEFGPRALGSRSILASPLQAEMQARLNMVKDREDFRPVAPAVLEEDAGEWFEQAASSPFMLFVYKVKEGRQDLIPAVTHVDGTARIQTVNSRQHQRYYDLLKAFKERTGVPVLINTSFNTLGKPIVCTPRDAVECFWSSPFDALVIGSYLIEK
ncbi:carbamoyltransferase C-terminal domain-containing protein [Chitinophaga sp. YIM B06452]|uniref:carbamoyltransferase family protein n=1 Tax=Chitinophaga sp. YIM B06452 TaxID=3082158 RepID=UPI0031FE6B15